MLAWPLWSHRGNARATKPSSDCSKGASWCQARASLFSQLQVHGLQPSGWDPALGDDEAIGELLPRRCSTVVHGGTLHWAWGRGSEGPPQPLSRVAPLKWPSNLWPLPLASGYRSHLGSLASHYDQAIFPSLRPDC